MTMSNVEQWAYIFSTFGKESVREILFPIAYSIRNDGENRRVVEFNNDGGYQALDITDHVDELENGQ